MTQKGSTILHFFILLRTTPVGSRRRVRVDAIAAGIHRTYQLHDHVARAFIHGDDHLT